MFGKKRLLATICTFIIMISMFMITIVNTMASNNVKIDGSYLTHQDYAVDRVYKGVQTRGTHLMDGESSITKAGKGRIYVYTGTTANHDVDYLSATIYVEKYNVKTNSWNQIDFWQVEDKNTYFVSTSKTMIVDRGYYYRVRGDHVAGMKGSPYDYASTITGGIWID